MKFDFQNIEKEVFIIAEIGIIMKVILSCRRTYYRSGIFKSQCCKISNHCTEKLVTSVIKRLDTLKKVSVFKGTDPSFIKICRK